MSDPKYSTEAEALRRKERISMAKEICSHRGENPGAVDRLGHEGWEKYEPLAGACIREAERLFALRSVAQAERQYSEEQIATAVEKVISGMLERGEITRGPSLPSTSRCTCAAIVNPNIPHARTCPLAPAHRGYPE